VGWQQGSRAAGHLHVILRSYFVFPAACLLRDGCCAALWMTLKPAGRSLQHTIMQQQQQQQQQQLQAHHAVPCMLLSSNTCPAVHRRSVRTKPQCCCHHLPDVASLSCVTTTVTCRLQLCFRCVVRFDSCCCRCCHCRRRAWPGQQEV
jgi:hypothetical protein